MFPVHRPHGIWFTKHIRRCRGHAVWTLVSATCSLHLTVPHLVDACTVWMRKGKPLISWMYCCPEFGSLVGGGTSQSLGTLLRMAVLHNCKVLCNSHCIFFFFCFVVPFSHCDKLIHKKFMMYIVSYNSVQNGLVYFKCLYVYMYVLWCTPERDFNKP